MKRVLRNAAADGSTTASRADGAVRADAAPPFNVATATEPQIRAALEAELARVAPDQRVDAGESTAAIADRLCTAIGYPVSDAGRSLVYRASYALTSASYVKGGAR